MIIVQANKLSKSYLENIIIEDVSFSIKKGDKVALVGLNGSGKTTLLNIISNLDSDFKGNIILNKKSKITYLNQIPNDKDISIYDYCKLSRKKIYFLEKEIRKTESLIERNPENQELMSKYQKLTHEYEYMNGYATNSYIRGILIGLNFDENQFDRNVLSLSGGERTRLALAALLSKESDLILLDEPTNHLDIESILWLEKHINSSNKTFLIASHDREFIDNTCSKIYELSNKKIYTYKGDFENFINERDKRLQLEEKMYNEFKEKVNKEKEKLSVYKSRSSRNSKFAARAKDRQKKLNRLIDDNNIKKPIKDGRNYKFEFNSGLTLSNNVIEVKDVTFGYNKGNLFTSNFKLYRGDALALIGRNGSGKTTLLKIIAGKLKPNSGAINIGRNIKVNYYDQNLYFENLDNNLVEEINYSFPKYSNPEIRNILASFGFKGDFVFNKLNTLSGGERARLSLLKLMLEENSLLLLDEPSNHLDYLSKASLENALISFPATIILVSHDRKILKKVCNKFYYISENNSFMSKNGYIEIENYISNRNKPVKKVKVKRHNQKSKKGKKIDFEKEIIDLENQIQKSELDLTDATIYNDNIKIKNILDDLKQKRIELDELYKKWEEHDNV